MIKGQYFSMNDIYANRRNKMRKNFKFLKECFKKNFKESFIKNYSELNKIIPYTFFNKRRFTSQSIFFKKFNILFFTKLDKAYIAENIKNFNLAVIKNGF